MHICCLWGEICLKFSEDYLSEKFSAEIELHKIDPRVFSFPCQGLDRITVWEYGTTSFNI
jgi:hypothetical protein